jgi:pilus assembly protein Flp/PilA
MKYFLVKIKSQRPPFFKKEKGTTLVEYAIMVVLVTVVSIAVIAGLGTEIRTTFTTVSSTINSVNG